MFALPVILFCLVLALMRIAALALIAVNGMVEALNEAVISDGKAFPWHLRWVAIAGQSRS